MAEWKKVKLSDVCEFIKNGYTYKATDSQHGVKISRIETISDRIINLNNVGYAEYPIDKKFLLHKGDILFSHINSLAHIGKTAYFDLNEELYHGMNLLCIRSNNLIVSKYLFYWLNSSKANNFYRSFAKKAINQCSISAKEVGRISFYLPPIKEQQKIAEILSTQDKLIELKQNLINQKKQQKKWLMQNLLTGKIRLKGFEGEWEKVRFKEMFTRLQRRNIENNVNVLTISAQYGLINQENFFSKSIASNDKSNYYLLYKGDFAYNKSYSNGYPFGAIKPLKKYEKGIVSPLYICFSPTIKNSCPNFYYYYFESGIFNKEIHAIAQEGARNHGLLNIGIEDFFNTYIYVPPIEEQTAIAEILSSQDKEIELLEKELEQEKLKKKALMQLLLTGKVRVI